MPHTYNLQSQTRPRIHGRATTAGGTQQIRKFQRSARGEHHRTAQAGRGGRRALCTAPMPTTSHARPNTSYALLALATHTQTRTHARHTSSHRTKHHATRLALRGPHTHTPAPVARPPAVGNPSSLPPLIPCSPQPAPRLSASSYPHGGWQRLGGGGGGGIGGGASARIRLHEAGQVLTRRGRARTRRAEHPALGLGAAAHQRAPTDSSHATARHTVTPL